MTTIKFIPPAGKDTEMKKGIAFAIATKHQCCTAMKEYENKSLEELRHEDYLAGRKDPHAAYRQMALLFRRPQQKQTTSTTGPSGDAIGSTTTDKPAFAMATKAVQGITENLTCSICYSLFTKPKALPCLHTFCEACIAEHISKTKKGVFFRCPMCTVPTPIPRGGAKGLKDHFDFSTMVEKIREVELHVSTQAQPNPSEQSDGDAKANTKCVIHPEEQLKMFCSHCNVLVCVDCAFASHSGHRLDSLKETSKAADEKLKQQVESAQREAGHLDSSVKEIVNLKAFCDREKRRVSAMISDYFESLCQGLRKQERDLLGSVEDASKNVENKLDTCLGVVNGKNQALKDGLKNAERLLKASSDVERIRSYQSTMDHLVEAQGQSVEVEVNMPSFSVTFTEMPDVKVDLNLSTKSSSFKIGQPK